MMNSACFTISSTPETITPPNFSMAAGASILPFLGMTYKVCPALARFVAMGRPMVPNPKNAIFAIKCLLFLIS